MIRSRIVLGLNSGTSVDGVDAVVCEIRGRGLNMRVQVLGHIQGRYAPELRRRILAIMAPAETSTEEVCRLNAEIGQAFADTAEKARRALDLKRVDLIGSHGQTVCHLPPGSRLKGRTRPRPVAKGRIAATLQIGDPAIIAARLRVPVVAHFREADMAVGGQGAPLVPWTDYVLLRHPRRNRIIQNIGGIANLTWLPAGQGPDQIQAFDTGPGNMIIDALVRHFSRGREMFDRNGQRAAHGKIEPRLLAEMLRHPFLKRLPPRSCGREEFGEAWVRRLLIEKAHRKIKVNDWIATATAFTAQSIALAYARFLPIRRTASRHLDEVILCGGGERNLALRNMLREYLVQELGEAANRLKIHTTADYDIATQAKEGVSFAMLAVACRDGIPANLPQVTGASRRVILGQITLTEPRP